MILLIDNYDSFTWNLVQRLGEIERGLQPGRDLVVVRNDAITPSEVEAMAPSGILISPGPCTPAEAGVSRAIIEHFGGRIPLLGVCLGQQVMADADGMRVVRHRVPMHGKTSPVHHDGRGLFAGLPSPFEAARYHSLVVEAASIPEPVEGRDAWEVTAWTDEPLDDPGGGTVRVVMGMRRRWADPGRAPLEGVQFHPESYLTAEGPTLLANFLERIRAGAGRVPA
ncbi:MAG: aminodeoxychorismate/anthranilate synthase component II [Planctomycetota bacterium]